MDGHDFIDDLARVRIGRHHVPRGGAEAAAEFVFPHARRSGRIVAQAAPQLIKHPIPLEFPLPKYAVNLRIFKDAPTPRSIPEALLRQRRIDLEAFRTGQPEGGYSA